MLSSSGVYLLQITLGQQRAWRRDLQGPSGTSHVCALCCVCFSFPWQLGGVRACDGYQERHGLRREKIQLAARSSWQVRTRGTESFVEEREREGILQEQSWYNLFDSVWKKWTKYFVEEGISDFSLSPCPFPRALLSSCWSNLFFSIIITWKDAGTPASRHYFISCWIALYKWSVSIVLLPFLAITNSATQWGRLSASFLNLHRYDTQINFATGLGHCSILPKYQQTWNLSQIHWR